MSAQREITDLTICRAIFAAWVFTYHVDLHANFSASLGPFGSLIRRGYLGVDGFFLLSGFILAKVHPELSLSSAAALRFWGRRLARIYPVHLAVLALLAAIAIAGTASGVVPHDPGRFSLNALGQDLLLIQAWGFASQLAWNYPSWSISTEWAGYLLFPALCFWTARCPKPFAAGLLVLCLAVLAAVSLHFGGLNLTFADSLWRFFPEFCAGILTARVFATAADSSHGLPEVIALAIVIAGLLTKTDPLTVAGLWLAITALACAAKPIFRDFKPLRFLGALSYAFYMSFATVELLLAQLGAREGFDPTNHKLSYALAMTLLTFALSLTLHTLIEKPARQRIDRRLQTPRPLAANSIPL